MKVKKLFLSTIVAFAMVLGAVFGIGLVSENNKVQKAYASAIAASNVYYFDGFNEVSFGTTMPTGYTFSDGTLTISSGATPYEILTKGSGSLAVKFEGNYGNNTVDISNEHGELTLTSTTPVDVTLAGLYSLEMIHIEGKVNLTITGPSNAGLMDSQFSKFLVGCPNGILYVEDDASVTAIDPDLHGATLGESDFEAIFKVDGLVLNTTGCFKVGLDTTSTSTDKTYAIKVISDYPVNYTKCDNGFVLYSNENKFICKGDNASDPYSIDYQTGLETKLKTIEDGNSLTIRQCQVSFDANGGSSTMDNESSYKGNYSLPSCTFTAPSGKQFKCWAVGSAGGTQYNAGASYTITDDVTFYAVWEDATLLALTGVSLNQETGVLSWDAFPGAADYGWSFSSGGGTNNGENTINLRDWARRWHKESGLYHWSVYAKDSGGNRISKITSSNIDDYGSNPNYVTGVSYLPYNYVSEQTALTTPQNLTWNHNTLSWDAVEGAESYTAFLYAADSDAFLTYLYPGTNTYYTHRFDVDKNYYIEVQANAADDDLDHKDSAKARSTTYRFNSLVASLADYVTLNNGILNINTTENAISSATLFSIGVNGEDEKGDNMSSGGEYTLDRLPVNLYVMLSGSGIVDGECFIRVTAYNEYEEQIAPTYVINNWEYDSSLGPQALDCTVSITGTPKYGETLTATIEDDNITADADIIYSWYYFTQYAGDHTYLLVKHTVKSKTDTYTINNADCMGYLILVRVETSVETGFVDSEKTTTVLRADGPAAPAGVGKTDCTTNANNNGTLTNVSTAMEYKLYTEEDWTDCDGTTVTGLSNGRYYVRYKATATHNASLYIYLDIAAYVDSTPYAITVNNGRAQVSAVDVTEASQGTTVTIVANAPILGYEFDAWTTSDGITFANVNSSTTTFVMINQIVTITATYKYTTLTGTVNISGIEKFGETLTASVIDSNNTGTLSYQWKRGVSDIDGATSSTYTLVEEDIGRTITVVVVSNNQTGSISSAATGMIAKADRNAPTGLTASACTNADNNDGQINGVSPEMKYKLSTASEWTDVLGVQLSGLTSGTYYVRYKETATHNESGNAVVVVGAYEEPTVYSVTVNNGSADPESAVEGATITIVANAAPAGKEFDAWVTEDGVVFANANSSTTTFEMPNKNVVVTATYKNIKVTITFNANGGTGSKTPVELNQGDNYTLPANPFVAPANKEFDGWSYTLNGEKIAGTQIIVNANTELFARWKDAEEIEAPIQPGTTDAEANNVGGLSAGAVVAIVLAVVIVGGCGGFAVVWFVVKKKTWADFVSLFKKK